MDFKNTIDATDRNYFYDGFPNLNEKLHPKHPVEVIQLEAKKKRDNLDFDVLKKGQGIHAPLRLMMERKLCSDIGRLPFLPSSNFMLEVLEGRQDDLDISDCFKDPMEQETFVHPNVVMDKKLGLL